jgi:pilus assembly protein CpaE
MGLVFLIGCDDPVSQNIAHDLEQHSGLEMRQFCSMDEAMHELSSARPTVVLVGPGEAPSEAIALAAFVQSHGLDSAVVLVAAQLDTSFLRSALRAGVADALASSDGPEAAIASVMEADAAIQRRRGASTAAEPTAEPVKAGKVVTVFSTKGGVGKSVLSTNVAAALASDYKKRTIIVDLDLEFGDVSVMLQLKPTRTIYDAAQSIDRLDAEMLKGFLVTHDSGLKALLAPIRPEEAESVTTVRIAQILDLLKTMADVVVVDTPASLSEVVLTAVERSDVVLAVATLDVPSVKNTKVSLQKLHQLGMNGNSVRLVLNRADSKVWLEPQEIERALADKIVARIPSDRLVPRCVNKGVPVVLDSPRTAVARSISMLAQQVIEN